MLQLVAMIEAPQPGTRSHLGNLLFHARPRWQRDGACLEHPELSWFPEKGGNAAGRAKAICAACLVSDECREYAIEGHEVGIWGGTSDRERTAIRMARQRAALPDAA